MVTGCFNFVLVFLGVYLFKTNNYIIPMCGNILLLKYITCTYSFKITSCNFKVIKFFPLFFVALYISNV